MELNLEVGKVYEFSNARGIIVIKVLQANDADYYVVKAEHNDFKPESVGTVAQLFKTSRLFNDFKIREVCVESYRVGTDEERKSSGVHPGLKKRRNKEEIAVDDFCDQLIIKGTIERLKAQIDGALVVGDKEVFMRLTKELQKFQKKVTA